MNRYTRDGRPEAYFVGNVSIDEERGLGRFDISKSLGGSAFNAFRQAHLLDVSGELHAAVGGDVNGKYVRDQIRTEGMPDRGIVELSDLSTLVYTQTYDSASSDVTIEKSPNAATDAHTLDMILDAMPEDLASSVVYIAGSTRKPTFMDPMFEMENFLDQLRWRGATLALDPGRPPEPSALRYHRAQSMIQHHENLDRIDLWAMNEKEFDVYLVRTDADHTRGVTAATVDELVDRYVYSRAEPALFCVTLGAEGLYLRNRQSSVIVDVPPLEGAEIRTTVGLGDSTKAGMIAAILHELEGQIGAEGLARLTPEQLQRIGAYGSAVSFHRMTNKRYGKRADIATTIDTRADHFQRYGVDPGYLS